MQSTANVCFEPILPDAAGCTNGRFIASHAHNQCKLLSQMTAVAFLEIPRAFLLSAFQKRIRDFDVYFLGNVYRVQLVSKVSVFV